MTNINEEEINLPFPPHNGPLCRSGRKRKLLRNNYNHIEERMDPVSPQKGGKGWRLKCLLSHSPKLAKGIDREDVLPLVSK